MTKIVDHNYQIEEAFRQCFYIVPDYQREIEYAPTDLPIDYLVMHAYATCEYLLRSNRPIGHGETIGANDREKVFRIERLQPGFFTKGPALRLSLLQS